MDAIKIKDGDVVTAFCFICNKIHSDIKVVDVGIYKCIWCGVSYMVMPKDCLK